MINPHFNNNNSLEENKLMHIQFLILLEFIDLKENPNNEGTDQDDLFNKALEANA